MTDGLEVNFDNKIVLTSIEQLKQDLEVLLRDRYKIDSHNENYLKSNVDIFIDKFMEASISSLKPIEFWTWFRVIRDFNNALDGMAVSIDSMILDSPQHLDNNDIIEITEKVKILQEKLLQFFHGDFSLNFLMKKWKNL